MRNYELMVVVNTDPTEEELKAFVAQMQGWVEEGQGKVVKADIWGRRKLAYQIAEFREGYYVALDLEMEPSATLQLERNLKLSELVLRHLLVRADE